MINKNKVFSFRNVGKEEIPSAIKTLNCKKSILSNGTTTNFRFHLEV